MSDLQQFNIANDGFVKFLAPLIQCDSRMNKVGGH